jgi:L-asparagine oxygenase
MTIFRPVNIEKPDANKLERLISLTDYSPYYQTELFIKDFECVNTDLSLSNEISDFINDTEHVAMLITGLPVAVPDTIPTPTSREDRAPKNTYLSEITLVTIANLLGVPFCFREENFGHLIQNLFPIRQDAVVQISSNSIELTMHVDAAYHPCAPDFTLLLCLRGQPGQSVYTYCSSMRKAIDSLDCQERSMLQEENFILEQELCYGGDQKAIVPIWSTQNGQDKFRFDVPLMKGINNKYQNIIDELADRLASQREGICLDAGDFLLIKNLECVHSRSAYRPNYDGRDRWLQRVFVCRNKEDLTKYQVSRFQISEQLFR